MKTTNYFLTTLFMLAVLTSCHWIDDKKFPVGGACVSDHYITYYGQARVGRTLQKGDSIDFRIPVGVDEGINIKGEGAQGQLYDSLAIKHHDIGYGREVNFMQWVYSNTHEPVDSIKTFENGASVADIVSIDVRSSEDWDEEHPAGTSLNDIISFSGSTIKNYILNKYVGSELTPVAMRLTDMTAEDYVLVLNFINDFRFSLIFDHLPSVMPEKPRRLNTVITFDDGSQLTCLIQTDY